jgi:hypothetical protein
VAAFFGPGDVRDVSDGHGRSIVSARSAAALDSRLALSWEIERADILARSADLDSAAIRLASLDELLNGGMKAVRKLA